MAPSMSTTAYSLNDRVLRGSLLHARLGAPRRRGEFSSADDEGPDRRDPGLRANASLTNRLPMVNTPSTGDQTAGTGRSRADLCAERAPNCAPGRQPLLPWTVFAERPRASPRAGLQSQLAGDAAGSSTEQVIDVDAELLQKAGVLIGVHLVGQLGLGLLRLITLALTTEKIQNLLLVDIHGSAVPIDRGGLNAFG